VNDDRLRQHMVLQNLFEALPRHAATMCLPAAVMIR
jgi:hypothetical protein